MKNCNMNIYKYKRILIKSFNLNILNYVLNKVFLYCFILQYINNKL